MSFATILDDSSPEKIRKSIFIFASIAIFSFIYQLEITTPKALFSAASNSVPIKISYTTILSILGVFQFYLVIRLFISWRVTKAKFKKFWILDEVSGLEDKDDLLKELQNFHAFTEKNSFPDVNSALKIETLVRALRQQVKSSATVVSEAVSSLNTSKNSLEDLRKLLTNNQNLMLELICRNSVDFEVEKQKILDNFPHIERITPDADNPKFMGELFNLTRDFLEKSKSLENKLINHCTLKFRNIEDGISSELSMIEVFPKIWKIYVPVIIILLMRFLNPVIKWH
ncbi:MAG: hypothetical protein HAW66_04650 [Shewanella sp.]|nr:hypothetical protein [Shewanella sp.]